MGAQHGTVRIAAVGDLHCPRTSEEELRGLFHRLPEEADILLLCGDLTEFGRVEEARRLGEHLAALRPLPILAVLGNHEFESGQQEEVSRVLTDQGVTILDGTAVEVHGIGFAGVKGFCGGFGERALQPWGESILKHFVRESVDETLKLESALAKLRAPSRVVVTHYAPVAETVRGEPPEIFPFLGSSRLEEPVNRYGASVLFHGHAHHGSLEGRTMGGVPVYNVAFPLLRRHFPDGRAVRILTLPVSSETPNAGREDFHAVQRNA
ncbi:putative phosphoesterase, ICC [Nitrospira japonica]|uniref:Putative phosphoesterase, ICC n=1 Tax=Nitrospira japonica TaxID=1325564 RepID=A0A1W1I2Z5_9BACT|nr:metallophosphoesterase [Nitrospira japonica]SLM47341.1 putative phosphoesterase, ICC [Nitrospira japonica]